MVKSITEQIKRSATTGDAESHERRKQCWIRTKEEVEEGLMKGPYSRARMDKRYKRGRWRCIGRNGVLQKGKWRCVDNGRASKHNKATTMYERITCGKPDFPALTTSHRSSCHSSRASSTIIPSELDKVVIFSDAEGKQRDGDEAPSDTSER